MEKRGISAVVTTLIIILLAIVALGIVWVVVRNIISQTKDDISLTSLNLDLEIEKTLVDDDTLRITVKRGGGEGEIFGINFVISDGDNSVVVRRDTNLPELGTETFTFLLSDLAVGIITSISIAPIYSDNSGSEVVGNVIDTVTSSSGSGGDSLGGGGGGSGGDDGSGGGSGAVCGNGALETGETCDDGNTVDGDGCSSTCQVEAGCVPVCDAFQCGDNGCGGSCGDCVALLGAGYTCGEDQQCYPPGCVDEDISVTCVDPIECGTIGNNCGTLVDCDTVLVGCSALQECNINTNLCEDILAVNTGTIANVWPPGTGIYFDSIDLTQEDGIYYFYSVAFPLVDLVNCYPIIDYAYDPLVHPNVIVQVFLTEPLTIQNGDSYSIWDSIVDCQNSLL